RSVVVEVALTEYSARLTKTAGQDVEVNRVNDVIKIRVAVERVSKQRVTCSDAERADRRWRDLRPKAVADAVAERARCGQRGVDRPGRAGAVPRSVVAPGDELIAEGRLRRSARRAEQRPARQVDHTGETDPLRSARHAGGNDELRVAAGDAETADGVI